jgi:hypothetical protein
VEVFLQLVSELLFEFGVAGLGEPFRQRTRAHPLLAGAGAVLMGGLAGGIAHLVWPMRIFQPGPIRGLSLVVSPILTGVVMDRYGQWREARGQLRSYIETFLGGALFAFGMALVRFALVGR